MAQKYIVEVNGDGYVVSQEPYKDGIVPPKELSVVNVVEYALIAFFLLWLVTRALVMTKQQSVKIIERLGKFSRIATAGVSFKIPLIDWVVGELDLRIQEVKEDVMVKSSDNVFVRVPVKVQYSVMEDKAKDAFYALSNPEEQMSSYIVNVVRSCATEMDMEAIFKSKNVFETEVKKDLDEKFGQWGFSVMNVLVDNPIPSDEVIASFDKVIASKRLREAAENEAEAIRIKTVANAKAEAESLTLKAEAYVKQRETIAKGMAEIIPSEKMGDYLIGIDVRDTVRDASKNGAVVIVPSSLDAGDIGKMIGSLKILNKRSGDSNNPQVKRTIDM